MLSASILHRETLQRISIPSRSMTGLPTRVSLLVEVAHVAGLWRYPVKSMGAEVLSEAQVSWHGMSGDRRWAFLRARAAGGGFPWLTLRERSDMGQYSPSFTNPQKPDTSPTVVRTPSGVVFDVGDRLDVQRFRPNILVEAVGDTVFPEDAWVGRVLRLGGMRMRVDKRDGRCVVITIDPVTAERNPAVLRAVANERQGCLGVYGTTVDPGSVAMGDPVLMESSE